MNVRRKIYGLYDMYPRRYGESKRVLYSKEEFLKYANRDNGFGNVFISIYYYESLKTENGITKIDSESAVIDKIFLDEDFKDFIDYNDFFKIHLEFKDLDDLTKEKLLKEYDNKKKDKAELKLFEKNIKLELEHLRKDNILRVWVYSGGGFHLYILSENRPRNKKAFIRNACDYISNLVCNKDETYIDRERKEKIRRLWDPHSPLKLSQMARVIGTYNPKRHLYCISLTEEDLDRGLEWIKEKAKKQDIHVYYLGNNLMKFDETLDVGEILERCNVVIDSGIETYSEDLIELLQSLGILFDEIPLCMKYFLKEDQKLDYTERYLIITFLYRCGLTENEIKEVLRIILTPDRLYHCCRVIKDGYVPSMLQKSRIETQIPSIIDNDYHISCSQIKNHGFCNPLCDLNDVLLYFS